MKRALQRLVIRALDAIYPRKTPEEWDTIFQVTIRRLGDVPIDDAEEMNRQVKQALDEETDKAYWRSQVGLDTRRRKVNGDA